MGTLKRILVVLLTERLEIDIPSLGMNDTSLTAAENAVQIPGVRATRLGLEIAEDLTPEATATLFACLEHIASCSNWLWGDALAYASRKWGNRYVDSKYKQASEATSLAVQTLKNARFTAERIPMTRRRTKLTFTHHAEVAFNFSDEAPQEQWLDRAISEKWTAIQLRKNIRLSKQEIHEEPNPEVGKYDPCAAYLTLAGWLREQNPEEWPDDQVTTWIDDLQPITEFHKRLLAIRAR